MLTCHVKIRIGKSKNVSSMPDSSPLQGQIFSIDRFVAEDGPGIRTTVFFKGCPLRCIWCHSPQAIAAQPQLAFNNNRCIGCGACVKACSRNAQIISTSERRVLWEKCDNCGKCAEQCPSKALEIVGEWLTVEQIMNILERDIVYYKNSGGGVTFSGGEPMAQPHFLASCLEKCKDRGIHTALDTCGLAKWSFFRDVLPYVDLLLYDIKHMNAAKHKLYTGVDNKLILDNLVRISQRGKPIWVRFPLIPGYNDSEKNLQQVAEFVKPLMAVEKVSLLPYNKASGVKYQFIGDKYRLERLIPHTREKVERFVEIFTHHGLKVELQR